MQKGRSVKTSEESFQSAPVARHFVCHDIEHPPYQSCGVLKSIAYGFSPGFAE